MLARVRDWFAEGPLGITVVVGVVSGVVLSQLLVILISAFVIPVLLRWRPRTAGRRRSAHRAA